MRGMMPHQSGQMKPGPQPGQMQHHPQNMQQHPQLGGGPPGGGMGRQPGQQLGMQMHPSMHPGGPHPHGQAGLGPPSHVQSGPAPHVQHQAPVGVGGPGHQASSQAPGQLLHHHAQQSRIPGSVQGHPSVGGQAGQSPMAASVSGRDMGGPVAAIQAPIHAGPAGGVHAAGLATISQKLTTCQTRMAEAMQVRASTVLLFFAFADQLFSLSGSGRTPLWLTFDGCALRRLRCSCNSTSQIYRSRRRIRYFHRIQNCAKLESRQITIDLRCLS